MCWVVMISPGLVEFKEFRDYVGCGVGSQCLKGGFGRVLLFAGFYSLLGL